MRNDGKSKSNKIKVMVEVDNFLLNEADNLTSIVSEILVCRSSSVKELVTLIGLGEKYIGFTTINGEIKAFDHILTEKDYVAFYPYVIGG